MREGWEYKKLGEVCADMTKGPFGSDIKKSLYVPKSSDTYKVYIQVNAIAKDPSLGDYYISKEYFDSKMHRFEVKPSDYIITCDGTLGKYLKLPENIEKGIISSSLLRLTLNDKIICGYFEYIWEYYVLRKLAKDTRNSALVHLPAASKIAKVEIPYPSLSTQESIVSELDKINELISLKKEQLKDYDNLAQSIFYDMFGDPVTNEKGWEVKKIGEIGTVERGAGISKKDFIDEGLPCIHYGQLHTVLGPTTKRHYSSIPESLLPKYKIAHTGDLIMAITSEDVEGSCKSTAWLGDYDIVIGSDAAILHHEQNGTFLSYYTMTKAFYNEKAKYAKGFKVTHISTKEIESIPIYLPPLPLQQAFAKRIEAIEQQKQLISSEIKDLETLLASRMQYWFD